MQLYVYVYTIFCFLKGCKPLVSRSSRDTRLEISKLQWLHVHILKSHEARNCIFFQVRKLLFGIRFHHWHLFDYYRWLMGGQARSQHSCLMKILPVNNWYTGFTQTSSARETTWQTETAWRQQSRFHLHPSHYQNIEICYKHKRWLWCFSFWVSRSYHLFAQFAQYTVLRHNCSFFLSSYKHHLCVAWCIFGNSLLSALVTKTANAGNTSWPHYLLTFKTGRKTAARFSIWKRYFPREQCFYRVEGY